MNHEPAPSGACGDDSIPLGHSLHGGTQCARLHYQLYVIGADVADTVRNVAGFMADRARQGWDVTASVLLPSDMRPIQVLGARHENVAVLTEEHAFVGAIAVAAQLINARPDVRQLVRTAARDGCELLVWGADVGPRLDLSLRTEIYTLSLAARAFKSHALQAVGEAPKAAAKHEEFHVGYAANAGG